MKRMLDNKLSKTWNQWGWCCRMVDAAKKKRKEGPFEYRIGKEGNSVRCVTFFGEVLEVTIKEEPLRVITTSSDGLPSRDLENGRETWDRPLMLGSPNGLQDAVHCSHRSYGPAKGSESKSPLRGAESPSTNNNATPPPRTVHQWRR